MDKTQLLDIKDTFCYLDLEKMESAFNFQQNIFEDEIGRLEKKISDIQMTRARVRERMRHESSKTKKEEER